MITLLQGRYDKIVYKYFPNLWAEKVLKELDELTETLVDERVI